jgi:hypothetical protein
MDVAKPKPAKDGPDDAEVINVFGVTSETDRRATIAGSALDVRPRGNLSREELVERRISNGVIALGDESVSDTNQEEVRIHSPAEIAEIAGRITIKTLSALIRSRGLETTTLGHAPPSRKGGPPRRLWGMTDAQLEQLLAVRKR